MAFAGLAYRAETVRSVSSAEDRPYAPAFRGATTGPGAMANAHDGQAFGSLALDPLLANPQDWGGGRSGMAYRASRPLLGWLVALTSFGSPWLAAWSLLAWTAIGTGLTALGAFVLAAQWGRRTDWVPLLLFLPGMVGQLLFGGLSDGLATGMALLGLAWWCAGRDRWAVTALALAALCRETTLLVPLALVLANLRDFRRTRSLLVPFVVYGAWVAAVWTRLSALPTDPGHGRLGAPLAGVLEAMPGWSWVGWLATASVVVLAAVAWRRAPLPAVRWLVVVSALFASMMGEAVWRSWDFTRPLLPVTVVGACLLARQATDGRAGRDRRDGGDEALQSAEAVPVQA